MNEPRACPRGDEPPAPEDVDAMFDALMPRYSLLNRILSLGLDRRWRRVAAGCVPPSPDLVVDLASGTGDQAQAVLRARPGCRVLALDRSARMVEALGRRFPSSAEIVRADALRIPLADASADAVTMSFGVRNVADPETLLREVRRVLRPGGRVVLLEAWLPRWGLRRGLLRLFLHVVAPALGRLLVGDARPYLYLARSVDRFTAGGSLAERLRGAGLAVVFERSLALGAVSLVVAEKDEKVREGHLTF